MLKPLSLVSCFLFGLILSPDASITAADNAPNIVLIMVDDMGYGDAGCFNENSQIATPNIDRIAQNGMRFLDAHAAGPLCHMSRYGLMTGRYPFRTNVGRWPNHALIDPGQMTLASMLKQRGYSTAMVGKWHLGFEENGYENPLPGGPVDVGFDSFFGIRASTDIPPYFYIRGDKAVEPPTRAIAASSSEGWSPIQGKFWREGLIAPDLDLQDVLPRFTDESIQVIEQHAAQRAKESEPLFLYLAYPAPHTPWLPSESFVGRSKAGMYGDFMEEVDAMIGKVVESLRENEMLDDTLLIFTSDNGPTWYEEDVAKFDHDASGGLRGMKADAWEAGHRVPFVVRWPGKVQAGTSTTRLVCFTDLFSTLASIAGYELQSSDAPDSFGFSDELFQASGTLDERAKDERAEVAAKRTSIVMRSGGGFMVFRDGNYKLIDSLGSGGFSSPRKRKAEAGEPPVQLYDLSQDLSESINIASARPDLVEKLKTEMKLIQERGFHRDGSGSE